MFSNIHRAAMQKMLNDKEMLERKHEFTINIFVEGKFLL